MKNKTDTENTVLRINKLIGQLKGIQKMVAEKRDCSAVLLQIGAIKAAVNNLGLEIAKSAICDMLPEKSHEEMSRVLKEVGRM